MKRPKRLLIGCLAVPAMILGAVAAAIVSSFTSASTPPALYARLPHHTPRQPDGFAFRFAMVHDVVHERFPKRGRAFYDVREARARERLKQIPPDSDEAFDLIDDIGVGLDRMGKAGEAVPLLRDKLARQERRGLRDRALYTTYANLGTFLVHANMKEAVGGNKEALARVKEGRDLVARAIEVNNDAHFGREAWQLVAIDFFVEAIEKPELLRTYDLVGNRLTANVPPVVGHVSPLFSDEEGSPGSSYGRPYAPDWPFELRGLNRRAAAEAKNPSPRRNVAKVGGEDIGVGRRAPFDEPCLGIIGMWRQGGGANPHFALCLGEIMLRVGQRHLAWACYERAHRLADKFGGNAALQQHLRDHCRRRQASIEASSGSKKPDHLLADFEEELAKGEAYQQEYQRYEAEKIAAGADPTADDFFDEFHRGRRPIASRSGPEEWYAGAKNVDVAYGVYRQLLFALFGGGMALMLYALAIRWLVRRRVRKLAADRPASPPTP